SKLEEVRELVLNLDQRPPCRHFQHEIRGTEQAAVADGRHEGVLRALDDLEADRAPSEPCAQEVLEVANQVRKRVLQVVVIVGWIIARAPLRRREGRKLAGKAHIL